MADKYEVVPREYFPPSKKLEERDFFMKINWMSIQKRGRLAWIIRK